MFSVKGPDLNVSRTPLDKKSYRQILLPNGLRAVLVSDTLAMQQDLYCNDDDSDEDEELDAKKRVDNTKLMNESKNKDKTHDDDDDENSDNASENENSAKDDDDDGLRDAAAAMVVGVGSMYDPPEAQGLAHFLEHMLFMGTEKYPQENAYDSFLSKHGGSDNAYTESEYTVYHLEVPQEKLFPALDMFAQFFIHPLMKEDAVERELNSIESEFQLSKNNDQCRLQQLQCHTAGTQPFCKFSWGNLKSLKEVPENNGVNVMELLRNFYNQYYYAANMRLVIIGAYTLDELQRQVEEKFKAIPTSPRQPPAFPIQYQNTHTWDATFQSVMTKQNLPMPESSLKKIYRLVPVQDRHTLSITWQVPSQIPHWKAKPCDFLAHLLGHEAQGSLLAYLKKKSWVTSCYAGVGSEGLEFASSHALFVMSFSLSEDGVAHWKQICLEVFTYIGMLRYLLSHHEMPAWIYEELKVTHEVSYRFSNEESPSDFVERIADRLAPHFNTPPDRLLDCRDLIFEYDEVAIQDLLDNYLTPSNTRVDLMSSHFGRQSDFGGHEEVGQENNMTCHDPKISGRPAMEPMFETYFWVEDIPEDTIAEWSKVAEPRMPPLDSMLSLPPINPFVPQNLELKKLPDNDSDHPLLNASLKLCIGVGKQKAWFPATAIKYNGISNQILLSYEDEEKKWHTFDNTQAELSMSSLTPGFEGTLDGKRIKFRVVALAKEGSGAVLLYGDGSDFEVEDGSLFPAIPPAVSKSRLPQLICNQKQLRLWHLQDRKFKRPIAELRLRLRCGGANKSPLHQACADLLVCLCADAVTEISYLASVCDLGSSISNDDVGFILRVHGFDDKLLALFLAIFPVLLSFRGPSGVDTLPDAISVARFQACHEILMRRYENSGLKSSHLARQVRIQCLRSTSWSAFEKSLAIKDITIPKFMATIQEIMTSVAADALIHGNIDSTDATAVREAILNCLATTVGNVLPSKKYPREPVNQIPSQMEPTIIVCPSKDINESNTTVEVYFQVGKDNVKDRVILDMLNHLMNEPLYDQIRTKDQFGYSVGCDSRWTCGIMGIHFVVISSTRSADEITKRIHTFLVEYWQTLREMKEEQFMENLVGLAKTKLERFNSLSEETGCYWTEIVDGRFDWEVYRNEVLALRSVTKDQVLASFEQWLLPSHGKTRELVVQVIGDGSTPCGIGRPNVDSDDISHFITTQVQNLQKVLGKSTWEKVF